MSLRFENITVKNEEQLKEFLSHHCTKGQENFTYFKNREISVLNNHVVTILGKDLSEKVVSYGHLDRDQDKVWLGVCVADICTGKGYGRETVEELIKKGLGLNLNVIHLTVYKNNYSAYNLYRSLGFIVEREDEKRYWMKFEYLR